MRDVDFRDLDPYLFTTVEGQVFLASREKPTETSRLMPSVGGGVASNAVLATVFPATSRPPRT